jgi:hypothetical protein
MEIDITDFERHEFAATRERFIGHAPHGSFTIRA